MHGSWVGALQRLTFWPRFVKENGRHIFGRYGRESLPGPGHIYPGSQRAGQGTDRLCAQKTSGPHVRHFLFNFSTIFLGNDSLDARVNFHELASIGTRENFNRYMGPFPWQS